MTRLVLAACLIAAVTVAGCDETDDAADASAVVESTVAGRQTFQPRCGACHVATAEQNRVGPHLVGIFGREAASVADFQYSDAMRDSGVVWDDETMAAYLRAPRTYIPGNRMAFAGLARDADIEAVLDYLRVVTAPQQN